MAAHYVCHGVTYMISVYLYYISVLSVIHHTYRQVSNKRRTLVGN